MSDLSSQERIDNTLTLLHLVVQYRRTFVVVVIVESMRVKLDYHASTKPHNLLVQRVVFVAVRLFRFDYHCRNL